MNKQVKIPYYQTERLLIENLKTEHASELFEPLSDPELYRLVDSVPLESVEKLTERFAFITNPDAPGESRIWLNWVSRCIETREPIGMIEGDVKGREAIIGYYTFTKHQKKGYAREGVRKIVQILSEEWSVTKITLEMDTRNRASAKLAESLGFKWVKTTSHACDLKGYQSHEFKYEYHVVS